MTMKITQATGKLFHIEYLRILCIWLVMFTHSSTAGFSLYLVQQDSPFFPLYLFVPFWVKTAVPIFFMISGALLLGKEESLFTLFRKRIFRFLQVIFVFSLINYIYFYHNLSLTFLGHVAKFFTMLYTTHMVTAYYFLYIYVAFLLMLPIWRVLVKNMTNTLFLYLIGLHLFFVGVIPVFSFLLFQGSGELHYFLNPLLAVSEPTFYFLIGYWAERRVHDEDITKKRLVLLGLAALVGTLIAATMTCLYGAAHGGLTEGYSERFYDSFLFLNTAFLYFTARYFFHHHSLSLKAQRVLLFLGSTAFGVMLTEEITRALTRIVLGTLLHRFPDIPFLDTILWISVAFVLGVFFTTLLKRIPYIKKLL